ncbi:MAG: cytochrome P450, partial [Paracoccaceae bacterium]
GARTLLTMPTGRQDALTPDNADATIQECLRFDPPLHMFTRHVYERMELAGHVFERGDEIGLLLGAANRDPARFEDANRFDPGRADAANISFGAGVHFCIGAPLARLEMKIALGTLWARCPKLRMVGQPRYGDRYHFHGLGRLMVTCPG